MTGHEVVEQAGPATRPSTPLRVLGVRHHGPGSARAVVAALAEHDPDVVLIEGPPEAGDLVSWVSRGLRPPVALMAYQVGDPACSAYWPFAVFSPEWQALSWAVEHHREVRFIDLPAANVLGLQAEAEAAAARALEAEDGTDEDDGPDEDLDAEGDPDLDLVAGDPHADQLAPYEPGTAQDEPADRVRTDPIAVLARTAGYDDPERWWDDVVEHRTEGDPFDAITEAMAELRETAPPARSPDEQLSEDRREAQMRQCLRAALRDHERVAVVCGAWHAPALSGTLPPVSADRALLRGLPKVKVSLAWVPWTHSRLSFASGYGAGIESPGWYQHLFRHPEQTVPRWFTAVAQVLRAADLPVSSAHAIEATRLAETLATLRGRPLAGLDEVQEAALAVMCEGSRLALGFVTRDLVVGEELGQVPDEAPLVPLDADLRRQAKSARLVQSPKPKDLVLDLRKEIDRAKSRLLHRLNVLGIGWGTPAYVSGTGTFQEAWTLVWEPELAVRIVVASTWGTTVAAAAEACLVAEVGDLADVTARVEQALLAELGGALPALLSALDARAAHEADIAHLMTALPALLRAQRYGNVRGTDTSLLTEVAEALLARVVAGLPAAVAGLAPDAAAGLRDTIDQVTDTISLLGPESADRWFAALDQVLHRTGVPGLLAGRLARTLFDADRLPREEAVAQLGRALSHGPTVAERAAFAEGFLSGSALLLVHDRQVLATVNQWVCELGPEDFIEVLPVLRRAFGSYNQPERRAIAERAALAEGGADWAVADGDDLPYAEMAAALTTVRLLLGAGSKEETRA